MRFTGWPRYLIIATWCATFGCVDRLPDQDLRIRSATPVAKVSADLIWKEYRENPDAAGRRYFGRAVEITGTVTAVGDDAPGRRFVLFGQGDGKT